LPMVKPEAKTLVFWLTALFFSEKSSKANYSEILLFAIGHIPGCCLYLIPDQIVQ
jgi:hypothetical protein